MKNTPWLVEEAVIFLDNYLKKNSDANILEYGSGGSTIWFAERTKNLVSIEHDSVWFTTVQQTLKEKNLKAECYLLPRPYYEKIFEKNRFDLILVDGRDRVRCVKAIVEKNILKSGGILMLDNSERSWYKPIHEILKDWKVEKYMHEWETSWWICK